MEMARLVPTRGKDCLLIRTSANKVDDTIPWILLQASAVFMLFKQYVNVVQLIEASKMIVQGDVETRERMRLDRAKRNT